MASRVPIQHYNLRSANSFIESSLHDLNSVERRLGKVDRIDEVGRNSATEDSLDNEDEPDSVGCLHESYRNTLQLHNVEVEDGHSVLENSGNSGPLYSILLVEDISPIESARAKFLDIIVDNFINDHVMEVRESPDVNSNGQLEQDKLNKRKSREVRYEGDHRFVLPLMYVANLYETLVREVNERLTSLDGVREKSIGVALEATGGLYRKLANKFPRKGPCAFKRRELATSLETRNKFPELVIQEERRVRFVVVNGLAIVEKPNTMPLEDAEWFKRLTGRHEVAISSKDYKFYSPRHKFRRMTSHSVSNIHGQPGFSCPENSPAMVTQTGFRPLCETQNPTLQATSKHHIQQAIHQPHFHPSNQANHQPMHQGQGTLFSHQCVHSPHMLEIPHTHQSPSMKHLPCLQPSNGAHVGSRMHVSPASPAKFCDECGAPYLRETSKFCSECGFKRPGI